MLDKLEKRQHIIEVLNEDVEFKKTNIIALKNLLYEEAHKWHRNIIILERGKVHLAMELKELQNKNNLLKNASEAVIKAQQNSIKVLEEKLRIKKIKEAGAKINPKEEWNICTKKEKDLKIKELEQKLHEKATIIKENNSEITLLRIEHANKIKAMTQELYYTTHKIRTQREKLQELSKGGVQI